MNAMSVPCLVCGHPETRRTDTFRSDTFGSLREYTHRECARCAHLFVEPQPTAEELDRLYVSPKYYELTGTERLLPDGFRDRPDWKTWEYGVLLRRLRRLGATGGDHLDIGCGWGLLMECSARAGWRPTGLDLSPEISAYVRDRLGLPVVARRLEEMGSAEWDLVSLIDVLEHVKDPVGFLRAIRRVLRPGGWLLIRVPNAHGFTYEMFPRWLNWWRGRRDPVFLQHLSEFRKRSLAEALRQAGFEVASVRGIENFRRYYQKPPLRRLAWRGLSAVGVLIGLPFTLIAVARRPTEP